MNNKLILSLRRFASYALMFGFVLCAISSFFTYYKTAQNNTIILEIGVLLVTVSLSIYLLTFLFELIMSRFDPHLAHNFMLRQFGTWKVPLIGLTHPTVETLDESQAVIKIPLNNRTKNHLDSMYFGALCIGADIAGGLCAMYQIDKSKEPVSLVFKDCNADFLKRAEGDVLFTCHDGAAIAEQLQHTITSGERVYIPVHITATVPSKLGDEPVAQFVMTLSLKYKK